MKLLIVDDHPGVRALIRQLAMLPGDAVRECGDGAAAIRTAREFHPDIVTMDVRLPDIDGIEVTRTLRADGLQAHIVIVTAYDQPAVRSAAQAAGAPHFVAKDCLFDLPALFARLDNPGGTPPAPTAEG